MLSKSTLTEKIKKRESAFKIVPDTGWNGIKPANTREEKINQIKNDFINIRPLLVVGATVEDFWEYPKIPANLSVHDLISSVDKLNQRKNKKQDLLIISGFDRVSASEQSKFLTLFKDRQIVASKLPDYIQLVVPVSDLKSVSRDARSLTFLLNV